MPKRDFVTEKDLAALAKKYREAAGKTRAEAAHELGVSRPTLTNAEEEVERSLTRIRIRIIETYSPLKVSGPLYCLEKALG